MSVRSMPQGIRVPGGRKHHAPLYLENLSSSPRGGAISDGEGYAKSGRGDRRHVGAAASTTPRKASLPNVYVGGWRHGATAANVQRHHTVAHHVQPVSRSTTANTGSTCAPGHVANSNNNNYQRLTDEESSSNTPPDGTSTTKKSKNGSGALQALWQNFVTQIRQSPVMTRRRSSSVNSRPTTAGHSGLHRNIVGVRSSSRSTVDVRSVDLLPTQFPDGRMPGVVGIRNHGNTCFMNAVVQCLSNTEYFVEYFVTGERCRRDAGAGAVAGRFRLTDRLERLLRSLWTCRYTPGVSAEFKDVVGRYSDQYSGSAQNDAQEFFLWLLDKVHDELGGGVRGGGGKRYSIGSKMDDNHDACEKVHFSAFWHRSASSG